MSGENADRDTITRLASEVVPALIERLAGSELGELEVREQGWRVRLRRPAASDGEAPQSGVAATGSKKPAPAASLGGHSGHSGQAGHSSTDGHGAWRELDGGLITSPAVGYFAPHGGIGVGSAISSGDLVGHVDVLGVRHEVVAQLGGTLEALEVEPGEAVEYGQPIARVTPERLVADV